MFLARNAAAPGEACLMTTISTFIANILLTVSIRVSPFFTELLEAVKFKTSADNLFAANSKEILVRVEFSKKILAMVMSRKDGTFLMGRLMTSLKESAVVKMVFISEVVKSRIPIK
jgi:hypothetical protein